MSNQEKIFLSWLIEQIKENALIKGQKSGFNCQYVLPDKLRIDLCHTGPMKVIVKDEIEIIVTQQDPYYQSIREEIAAMNKRKQKTKDEELKKLLEDWNRKKN